MIPDGMKTLIFGHYELDNYALDEINWSDEDVEWVYENFGNFSGLQLSWSPDGDKTFVVPQSSPEETNTQSSNTWQPPKPGFLAAELVNTDIVIGSTDIVIFDDRMDKSSSSDNPFNNFEAEEATTSEPNEPVFKSAKCY